LAQVEWPPGGKEAFLRQQFEAQDTYWREQRPDAVFQVIEVDGAPAGRLYVDAGPDDVRIVDIALLPEFRGRGVGTALLEEIIERAGAAGTPVTIHVEQQNPARSLYKRLGFAQVATHGIYDLLERSPAPR
jgi:ribosomal protein S18 acetylase RimI-like enzyme